MPRYHFNVYDGYTAIDHVGTELAGPSEARRLALKRAGRVLDGEAEKLEAADDWRLEVTDGAGLVLFVLNFTLIGAPVMLRDQPDHLRTRGKG